MSEASDQDTELFLKTFKETVRSNGLNIWPTEKNKDFLLESGFTNEDVEEIILSLKVRDYESGPSSDKKDFRADGEVWVFSREYEGFELYIKVKLRNGQPIAECLSAHEAEFEMKKPKRDRK